MAKFILILVIVLFRLADAYGEDAADHVVGKSLCAIGIDKGAGYGIGLDRSNGRYLAVREINRVRFLMIVEYHDEKDKCGIVKDAVFTSNLQTQFEFNCQSSKHPFGVFVGEIISRKKWDKAQAARAWLVDLEAVKLRPASGRVICYNTSYSGPDAGDDLAAWAKKREK